MRRLSSNTFEESSMNTSRKNEFWSWKEWKEDIRDFFRDPNSWIILLSGLVIGLILGITVWK